jgi:NADH-quinone oxidoreductase subunit B
MGVIQDKVLPSTLYKVGGLGEISMTTVDFFIDWARKSSIWPLTFGLACCAIEMMAAYATRFDVNRLGVIPRPSPRQADSNDHRRNRDQKNGSRH